MVETEPGLKSATASSVTKPAKLETGLVVQVPPFINEGEKIRVDTAEGAYLSHGRPEKRERSSHHINRLKSMVRYYVVKGRVQGVGFRWLVHHEAGARGLKGWVRNTEAAEVEVMVAGSEEKLAELRSVLQRGSRGSRVDAVQERTWTKPWPTASNHSELKEPGKTHASSPN